jgi:hypothetical protein
MFYFPFSANHTGDGAAFQQDRGSLAVFFAFMRVV